MVLKISVVSAVVSALLIGFLVVRTGDETAVHGTTTVITVYDAGDILSRDEARTFLAATARENKLTLYRSVNTVVGDRPVRTLYVVNRGDDRSLPSPASAYPSFGRSLSTRFLPTSSPESDSSVAGMYVTGGSQAAAAKFALTLRERGMTARTKGFGPLAVILWTAEIAPLIPLVLAALVGLVLGCIQSTIGYRRQDAIRRVNGASWQRVVFDHVGHVVLLSLEVGLAGLLASFPVLAAYNGLAQFSGFVVAAGVGIGAVAAAAGSLVLVTSLAGSRGPSVAALSGDRPLRRLAGFGICAHTASLALVILVVAVVAASGVNARENHPDSALWLAAKQYVSLNFRVSNAEFEAAATRVSQIGREAFDTGDALVVIDSVDLTAQGDRDYKDSMIVNTRYLDEQQVRDRSGRRVTSDSVRSAALTLLVPENLTVSKHTLIEGCREWIQSQAELDGDKMGAGEAMTIPIDFVITPSGQRRFTYQTSGPTSNLVDPVIAVLPTAHSLLSDDWISSEMTQGGVLFDDEKELLADLRRVGLEPFISSNRVSDLAVVRLNDQDRALRANVFAGVVALELAIFSALILASAIAERNRRIDFIRHVHGRSTLISVAVPAATLTALGACILGLASAAGLFLTTTTLATACLVVLSDVVIVSAVILVRRRQLRLDFAHKS